MAYDKVVDSTQLDADLKIVADAIRSKGGTTEQLAFPQGMKQAVEAIQTGGGSAEIKEASGTFTLIEDCTSYAIDVTELGWQPDLVFVELDETDFSYTTTPTKAWFMIDFPIVSESGRASYGSNKDWYYKTNICTLWRGGQGTNVHQIAASTTTGVHTGIANEKHDGEIVIHIYRSATSYPIIAGNYRWYAYKIWGDV